MRKIREEWGQPIALLAALIALLGLLQLQFNSLRSDIKQVRTELGADIEQVQTELGDDIEQVRIELGADIERLEDRLDARLFRIEGHVAGLAGRVAHIEGHLGLVGSPPPKAKD